MFTKAHHTTGDAQRIKDLPSHAAPQSMKMPCFILPAKGFVWHVRRFTGHFLQKHVLKSMGQMPDKMSCWLTISQTPPWVIGLPIQGPNFSMSFTSYPMLWYIVISHRHTLGLTFPDTCQCNCQFHPWERVQNAGINHFTSKRHGNRKTRKVTILAARAAQWRAPPAPVVPKASCWKPGSWSHEKCHNGLKERLFLVEHRNNTSNEKNCTYLE